jgi:hypothetical protein
MRVTVESVRLHVLLIIVAAAVLAVGCGEGNALESSTGPSSTLSASTALTGDGDAVAMASSTGEADTLKKGGNGNGNGNRDDPGRSHEAKVVGFVSDKSGDTLTVRGTTVTAGSGALIRHGNRILTMGDIHVGDHVQARGEMDGSTLVAVEIKVQDTDRDGDDDDDDDEDKTELEGTISALSSTGNCPVVTFMIGTTKVTTSASTTFDDVSCGNLANNARVEVQGLKQSDGSVLATKVELQSGPDEVEGTVFEFSGSGSCPSATFKVGATAISATKVTTTNSTTFSGVSCATLTNGAKVEVEGSKQGDGSITAASVELK